MLVKVKYSSINSWDRDLLRGTLQGRLAGLRRPKYNILGLDIAGIIEKVGKNVTRFNVGDEVFGDISGIGKNNFGGFAEYTIADPDRLAIKPKTIDFSVASAIPQAGVLALQGLYNNDNARIKDNQRFLFIGGGGGVGTFAFQMAKMLGAEVTVVDREEKLDKLEQLGADNVIDYTKEKVLDKITKYDLIHDVVAKQSITNINRSLNENGTYLVIGGSTWGILKSVIGGGIVSKFNSKSIGILAHYPNSEDTEKITKFVEDGKISPVIDREFHLQEIVEAFEYYETGTFVGKIIINHGE